MTLQTNNLGPSECRDRIGAAHAHLQALIFDVDGTLADTEEIHRQAFNTAFSEHGLDWNWNVGLYTELLKITGGKERIAAYISRLHITPAEQARYAQLIPLLHRTKTWVFASLVRLGHVRLRIGVRRLVTEAVKQGLRIAIASTTNAENVDALISASFGPHAREIFGVIATGDVVLHKKPAPDIYCLALASLGIAPHQAVAIEDSQNGVRAAKAAGLVTIATPTRWTLAEDFSQADLVLSSLGEPHIPLPDTEVPKISAPYLGLEQLARVHASKLGPREAPTSR